MESTEVRGGSANTFSDNPPDTAQASSQGSSYGRISSAGRPGSRPARRAPREARQRAPEAPVQSGGEPPVVDQQTPSGGTALDKLNLSPQNPVATRGDSKGLSIAHNSPRESEQTNSAETSGDDPAITLRKRAAAKEATIGLVKKLDGLDSPVPYDRAYSCCQRIDQEDGRLTSHYCNARWCVVCSRIRCGRHVNNQLPVVRSWGNPHMVTLTVPNIPWKEGRDAAGRLRGLYEEMLHKFNLAKRAINRTRGLDFRALRAFQVTYNRERGGSLNGHYHVVVPSREIAEALKEEWLKRWPKAAAPAQDVRPMGDTEKDLLEVCKYVTRITGGEREVSAYPITVLDAIFRALKGKKMIQSVGYSPADFGGDEDEEIEEMEELSVQIRAFKRPMENTSWHWSEQLSDWVDRTTGELLSEYGYTTTGEVASRYTTN